MRRKVSKRVGERERKRVRVRKWDRWRETDPSPHLHKCHLLISFAKLCPWCYRRGEREKKRKKERDNVYQSLPKKLEIAAFVIWRSLVWHLARWTICLFVKAPEQAWKGCVQAEDYKAVRQVDLEWRASLPIPTHMLTAANKGKLSHERKLSVLHHVPSSHYRLQSCLHN